MPILNQKLIRQYETSKLYSIIHNFQKKADDEHLIVYRHPIEKEQEESSEDNMRSKNREKNIRRQEQNRSNYNQNNNERVANDLGNFLGGNSLPAPNGNQQYQNNYQGGNYGYNNIPQQGNQLPQSTNQLPEPTQNINPQPDYQVENNDNSLNSPSMQEPPANNSNYFDLNQPNYYQNQPNTINNQNNYYQQPNQELPQQEYPQQQMPQPQEQVTETPAPAQIQAEQPNQEEVQPQPEQTEPNTENATVTYTDENGNTTEQDTIPVDLPNTNTVDTPDNTGEENAAANSAIKPINNDNESTVTQPDEDEEEEYDNSEEKSRIFQEIQNSINTRKWIESIQEIQLAQKANFDNLPIDHIDLVGISNGVSDHTNYRIDLDPMFFKLFKIILIGQNLDITLLARDGNSTEINIAPPDWVQNDKYKDVLIDGNYLYSYDENLDFDKLLKTLYRFTYRPVQTKGYTELFITDLPIYPIARKGN